MTVDLAVTLHEDEKGRLDAIAAARKETTAEVLREAVTQYLEYDSWFRVEVQKGLDSANRGELIDFDDVKQKAHALLASDNSKD